MHFLSHSKLLHRSWAHTLPRKFYKVKDKNQNFEHRRTISEFTRLGFYFFALTSFLFYFSLQYLICYPYFLSCCRGKLKSLKRMKLKQKSHLHHVNSFKSLMRPSMAFSGFLLCLVTKRHWFFFNLVAVLVATSFCCKLQYECSSIQAQNIKYKTCTE